MFQLFSLVTCPFKCFACYFFFFLLSIQSYLCILDTSPLSYIHDTLFCSLPFNFLNSIFLRAKVLNFSMSNLAFFFLLRILLILSSLKTFCITTSHKDFLLCFLLEIYSLTFYISTYDLISI